jgi:hypothetical protein
MIPGTHSSLVPEPTGNPYINTTALTLREFYLIKRNGSCAYPTENACLTSLLAKFPSNTTTDPYYPLSPYVPSPYKNVYNSSASTSSESVIDADTATSNDPRHLGFLWIWIGIVLLALLACVGALVYGLIKCCLNGCTRRPPPPVPNANAQAARSMKRRLCWEQVKAKFQSRPRVSSPFHSGGIRGGNGNGASGGSRAGSSRSTRKPTPNHSPSSNGSEWSPPPYIGGDLDAPEINGRERSGSGLHMPPPIYEMAGLGRRHDDVEQGLPHSGEERYGWEDGSADAGRAGLRGNDLSAGHGAGLHW